MTRTASGTDAGTSEAVVAPAGSQAAGPLPVGGADTMDRDCPRCGLATVWRWERDGGPGRWVQEHHECPSGLPCRWREFKPLAEEHTQRGCPACDEGKPKRKRRSSRRRRRG